MTLLGRIARILLGQPTIEDAPADSGREGGGRRRRGRRGGRRRRGRGAGDGDEDGDAKATTTTNATTTDDTDARRGTRTVTATERQSRGAPQRDRRGRRTPRALLDEPLPEDIAFRPVSDGGDQSIVPGRRRPRPGSRTTQRVVAGGSRYVTGFSASEPPESGRIPTGDPAIPDSSGGDTPADSGSRRRRRGRRGGRGRGGRGSGSGDSAQDGNP